MLYTKELSFFKSFMESFKIKVNTITEKELPQNIDSGIRKTLGLDDEIGSIAVGKFADLVVLDKDLNVCKTFINGKCEYEG